MDLVMVTTQKQRLLRVALQRLEGLEWKWAANLRRSVDCLALVT